MLFVYNKIAYYFQDSVQQRKDRSELNYYCVYIAKPTNDGADCCYKFYEGPFHLRRVFTVSYISFRILAMFKFWV